MINQILRILRDNRASLIDEVHRRVVATIPRYALLDPQDLRASVEGFYEDITSLLEREDDPRLMQRMLEVSQKRVQMGISAGDFLRALLVLFPVVREAVRTHGGDTPGLAAEFGRLEVVLHDSAVTAANMYTEHVTRQLAQKNQELNRLTQELRTRERLLTTEARQVERALASANEFNHRVIESLSSGVAVIDHKTRTFTLISSRMEEILGVQAQELLGLPAERASVIKGLNVEGMVASVYAMGHVPLSKVRVTPPDGRARWIYVRAERMYDENGEPEGTVVIIDDVTERELLIDSFSRYVSRDVLNRLLARAQVPGLEAERRTISVLFADIRGFTSVAEKLTPEQLHELLNAYFRSMIAGITSHGGFIDKFIGDKVMALFTNAADPAGSALGAVRAALQIKKDLEVLSRERVAAGQPPVDVGIGINTGQVLLGNVGSEERMDFTAIGDPVNVADRLQALAKGGEILVGEECARIIDGKVKFVDKGLQQVKGRAASVRVFEIDPSEYGRPA